MTSPSRRDTLALASAATIASLAGPAATPAAAQTPAPAQAPGFYRMRLGDMIVTAINEGSAPRPNVEGLVRNVPTADVEATLRAQFQPTAPFLNHFTTLVIESGNRLVLLDTGLGEFGAPGTGLWLRNFRAAGFDPARVTHIAISHFHGDHIGGIRNRAGELVFPNAEISVPAPEWDFWMSDERMNALPEGQRGGFMNARRVFAPIAANVKRFAPGAEIVTGVTSVAAHGHSPGHCTFALASGAARLLFVGDAITTPALYVRNPDWSPFFDMNEEMGRATRRRLLDMAASERMMLHVYHAPFPAQGFVSRAGNGFDFTPAPWNPAV